MDMPSTNLQPHENSFEKLAMCNETPTWNKQPTGRGVRCTTIKYARFVLVLKPLYWVRSDKKIVFLTKIRHLTSRACARFWNRFARCLRNHITLKFDTFLNWQSSKLFEPLNLINVVASKVHKIWSLVFLSDIENKETFHLCPVINGAKADRLDLDITIACVKWCICTCAIVSFMLFITMTS